MRFLACENCADGAQNVLCEWEDKFTDWWGDKREIKGFEVGDPIPKGVRWVTGQADAVKGMMICYHLKRLTPLHHVIVLRKPPKWKDRPVKDYY